MEGIINLLKKVYVGDISIYDGVSPLIQECQKITNNNEKEFQHCLRDAAYIVLYVAENYELPPGIPVEQENESSTQTPVAAAVPAAAHTINSWKFQYIKVRL